jgi:hypothetical protein
VGENLEPDQSAIPNAMQDCSPHFASGQILILRSTVYPGVTARVEKMVAGLGAELDVAFCPERIAEGKAMTGLFELPQIVSSRTARAGPGQPPVPQADADAGADDAGGSRAGEAVHQYLAVHQIRHSESALHDGQ